MNKINYDESGFYNPEYSLSKGFIDQHNNIDGKASDFRAILLNLKDFFDNEDVENYLNYLLLKPGPLTKEELDCYKRVYREGIKEIYNMVQVKTNQDVIKYLGLTKNGEGTV